MHTFRLEELYLLEYRWFVHDDDVLFKPGMNMCDIVPWGNDATLLDAVAVVLGGYLESFKTYVPRKYVPKISDDDASDYPCELSCFLQWDDEMIDFCRVKFRNSGVTKFADDDNPMALVVSEWESLIARADHSDKGLVLPLVLYLDASRPMSQKCAVKPNGVYGRLDAYADCLNKDHGIGMAYAYMHMLQSAALLENDCRPYPAYEVIMRALNAVFDDALGIARCKTVSNRFGKNTTMFVTKDGFDVPFSELSDEYHCIFEVVLDIAARMAMLNPYLKDGALSQTPGLVLINAVPQTESWDKVIRLLPELFPNVQFICIPKVDGVAS